LHYHYLFDKEDIKIKAVVFSCNLNRLWEIYIWYF